MLLATLARARQAEKAHGAVPATFPPRPTPPSPGARTKAVAGWRWPPQGGKDVAWRTRITGCHPPARIVRHRRGLHNPRSVNTTTCISLGRAGRHWRRRRPRGRSHAPLRVAGQRCHAPGPALPRYKTLRTNAATRCPCQGAYTAKAHSRSCHPPQPPAEYRHATLRPLDLDAPRRGLLPPSIQPFPQIVPDRVKAAARQGRPHPRVLTRPLGSHGPRHPQGSPATVSRP